MTMYWVPPAASREHALAAGSNIPPAATVRHQTESLTPAQYAQQGLRVETTSPFAVTGVGNSLTSRGDVILLSVSQVSATDATTQMQTTVTDVGAGTSATERAVVRTVAVDPSLNVAGAPPDANNLSDGTQQAQSQTSAAPVDSANSAPTATQASPDNAVYESSDLSQSLDSQGFTPDQQQQITQEVTVAQQAERAAGYSSALGHF